VLTDALSERICFGGTEGVVVEVDGPEHREPNHYYQDRLRDYELLISGYLVLRIPNELVMSDCERAVEMIRKVVQLQQSRL
jgi:very-short-patch-repair endonuclease